MLYGKILSRKCALKMQGKDQNQVLLTNVEDDPWEAVDNAFDEGYKIFGL